MTTRNVDDDEINDCGVIVESLIQSPTWKELSSLRIIGSKKLKQVTKEQCSDNLSILNCSRCRNLELVEPSKTVYSLVLSQCKNLKTLSILHLKKLKILNLQGCEKIEWTPELDEHLQFLARNGCDIVYPENHPQYQQNLTNIQDIKTTKSRIEQLSDDKTANLYFLFNGYLGGNFGERQTKAELARNVFFLLELLDANPECQVFMNDIAEEFVVDSGDGNQNYAGIFQISHWLSVANQKNIEDKLEHLKPLIIYNFISDFVALNAEGQGLDSSGKQFLTNAFFKEVYQKFNQEEHSIEFFLAPIFLFERRAGIDLTKGLTFYATDFNGVKQDSDNKDQRGKEALTQFKIEELYVKALSILQNSAEENIEVFFGKDEKKAEIWGRIALPKDHFTKINDRHQGSDFESSSSGDIWLQGVNIIKKLSFTKEITEATRSLIISRLRAPSVSPEIGKANNRGVESFQSSQDGFSL